MYQRRAAKFGQAHGNHIWCRSAPAWQPHRSRHTITIEIDEELLTQVTEVLKHYGLTPEEAAVQFFEYCADSKTQYHAIKLLKMWKEEQEAQERNSTNAK